MDPKMIAFLSELKELGGSFVSKLQDIRGVEKSKGPRGTVIHIPISRGANRLTAGKPFEGTTVRMLPTSKVSPTISLGIGGMQPGIRIEKTRVKTPEDTKEQDWSMGHEKLNPEHYEKK